MLTKSGLLHMLISNKDLGVGRADCEAACREPGFPEAEYQACLTQVYGSNKPRPIMQFVEIKQVDPKWKEKLLSYATKIVGQKQNYSAKFVACRLKGYLKSRNPACPESEIMEIANYVWDRWQADLMSKFEAWKAKNSPNGGRPTNGWKPE